MGFYKTKVHGIIGNKNTQLILNTQVLFFINYKRFMQCILR